jgi:glutathione synthase
MSLRIAFQMDRLEGIKLETDTTYMMMQSAAGRQYRLFCYEPYQLSMEGGRISTRAREVRILSTGGYEIADECELDLRDDVDVVMLRQDPPFDMAYVTTTYMLEKLKGYTLVVNDPVAVRDCPEKMLVTQFPDLHPQTLISSDPHALERFFHTHGDCILKPLHGAAGSGVIRLKEGDRNLGALVEIFNGINRDPLVIQKFLPAVSEGDKRIILVDGKPVGAINRIPPKGAVRSNLRVGGRAEPVKLTKRDLFICDAIGPYLVERNLIFVGIDVIGEYLTEINVTSPTGARQVFQFDGVDVTQTMWDSVDSRMT